MSPTGNAAMGRLDVLAGTWEMDAVIDGAVMATARTTFAWIGGLLHQHAEAVELRESEWAAGSPLPTDGVIGADDHTGAYTMLYADARGVNRVYAMTFDDGRWTLAGRPGPTFHQRYEGRLSDAGDRIDGRWEASEDGATWRLDFEAIHRRVA